MIDIEITKNFNDDIMFPMDIYTINIYRYNDKRIKNYEICSKTKGNVASNGKSSR